MEKLIVILVATTMIFSACAASTSGTPNVDSPSSFMMQEIQSESMEIALPENYDGKTEFVIANQTILPIKDSVNIAELYTSDLEDGTHTVFQVEYDAAWVRETTCLSFNSTDSPTFFDNPNREYKGFWLDTKNLFYQKVSAGDTYKGYIVKEAKTTFESLEGNAIFSTITLEGDIVLYGNLAFFADDMITFRPFAQGNKILPILSVADGLNLTWSDQYSQIDDNGLAYLIEDTSDSIITLLKEKSTLDVEVNISELTLTFSDNATSANSCEITEIKAM